MKYDGEQTIKPLYEVLVQNAKEEALMKTREGAAMTEKELEHCRGCYCDHYNRRSSTTDKCFHLPTMTLVMRKEVHVDQVPPWKQRAKRLPKCYRRQRYVYVSPERTC